jgi:hypothetical protein
MTPQFPARYDMRILSDANALTSINIDKGSVWTRYYGMNVLEDEWGKGVNNSAGVKVF